MLHTSPPSPDHVAARAFRAILLFATLPLGIATAQCGPNTNAGEPAPGTRPGGDILVTCWWDPDGSGPRSPVIACGGSFSIPSVGARNLATWDPATRRWGGIPQPPDGLVQSLAAMPNGHLAVGGTFATVGGLPANRIAIWDGVSWTCPGGGVTAANTPYPSANALQAMPNGDLVAGGRFTHLGGVPVQGLGRWDGAQWHALGAFQGDVNCLALTPNGHLLVGGRFPPIGYPGFQNIAEWDGAAWWNLPPGPIGALSYVDRVAVLDTGDVVVGGLFNLIGSSAGHHLARFDGTAWSALDNGVTCSGPLLALPGGQLLAGFVDVIQSVPVLGVGRWDGSQWSSYAPDMHGAHSLMLDPAGGLLAFGRLTTSGVSLGGLAIWRNGAWSAPTGGFDGTMKTLVTLPSGELVCAGDFTTYSRQGIACEGLWSGPGAPNLTPMNAGATWLEGANCAFVDDADTLWMAGDPVPMTSLPNVGWWDGAAWHPVGTQLPAVHSIVVPPDQQPIVGLEQDLWIPNVLRWNGTQWEMVGMWIYGTIHALLQRPNADLIAGGTLLQSGNLVLSHIARWDGTTWQPMASGFDGTVRTLIELPNGDLVAGGEFLTDGVQSLNLIARWDGSRWHPFGAGLTGDPGAAVHALHVMPDGDLLAGGDFRFAGGAPVRGLARWDGTQWRAVDGPVDGTVRAIAQLPDGTLAIGGDFATVGGTDAAHFAWLAPTCPATSTAYGAGCAGATGTHSLAASGLPWLGTTWQANCTGVPPTAVALDLVGLQATALPLTTLHPAATIGCQLLASPDAVTLRLPMQGVVHSSFALPRVLPLVGVTLHQQIVVGDFAGPTLQSLTSSNALTLRMGAL